MSFDSEDALGVFSKTCIRCGICATTDCGNFTPGVPCLGDICDSLLAGDIDYVNFPFTCALCNRCTINCPQDLHAVDACKPARAILLDDLEGLRDRYRIFRTDLKHNFFSLLTGHAAGSCEERHLIEGVADVGGEADHTAFFPGCSLYSYGPSLVEAASGWLRGEGIAAFTVKFCCGATFYDVGFFEEFDQYRRGAVRFLQEHSIEHLVITCPHCAHLLPELLEGSGIDFTLLPRLLLERGKLCPPGAQVAIHDSCYDRDEGIFAEAVRELLASSDLRSMPHERRDCLCCGGGGMVSAYAPDFCTYRRNLRLAEMDASGAEQVVSACFSCVNSLQRGVDKVPAKHYLELVFGIDIDWKSVYEAVDALYSDPQTADLLASDEKMFP